MRARALAFFSTAVVGGALLTAQAGNNAGAEARSGLASASARKAAPSNAVVVVDVDKAIAQASQLLDRADKLRQLGDLTRADLAEEAALEWAHAAHAALDAHEIALDADHLGEAADVAQKKADKARTALDAAIERRATLAAELAKLDAEATEKAMESLSQKPKGKPGKVGK